MKSRLARPGPGSFREAPAQLVKVHNQFAASGSVATWERRGGAARQLSRGFRHNFPPGAARQGVFPVCSKWQYSDLERRRGPSKSMSRASHPTSQMLVKYYFSP